MRIILRVYDSCNRKDVWVNKPADAGELSQQLWQFTGAKSRGREPGVDDLFEINSGTVIALAVFVKSINLASLALITALVVIPTAAHGQTVAALERSDVEGRITGFRTADKDQILAARALAALQRLDRDVLVYRSLGDFEESGKLARVSFDAFKNDLQAVTEEVRPLLSRLPPSRLKTEIRNALDSYRDGAFWWQKIDQPRVVLISALSFSEETRTPSDTALLANVPYTVAIHWRQAEKYLKRAEGMMNGLQNRER